MAKRTDYLLKQVIQATGQTSRAVLAADSVKVATHFFTIVNVKKLVVTVGN